MRRALPYLAADAAVFTAACSDASSPTQPGAPEFQVGTGPACDLTALRRATGTLFGNQSAEAQIAKQFTQQNKNTAAVTPFAYNLFAAIATASDGAGWTSLNAEQGADLSVKIIACSDVIYTDLSLSGTANLSAAVAAFTAALGPAGTYEVRGGGLEGTVVSHNAKAGLQPPTTFAAWFPGGRTLIIGHPVLSFADEISGGATYDFSMVRPAGSAALAGLATIGLCTNTPIADPLLRIQHLPRDEGGNIIPITTWNGSGLNCITQGATRAQQPTSLALRVFRSVVKVFEPAPLHASAVGFGPVGGLLGDFSPIEVVYPAEIVMNFDVEPVDADKFQAIPVEVSVKGAEGTPWEGVVIRLEAFANNGQPMVVCGAEAVTDAQGVATFVNFAVGKVGGASIRATTVEPNLDPDVASYPTTSIETDGHINVRPSTLTSCPGA